MSAVVREHHASVDVREGVLTLSGYGLRMAVEGAHLVVEDGLGKARRRGRFSRVSPQLRRVVILGHSGTVSLEALRWLRDVDVPFIQLGLDGEVITVSAQRRLDDVRLRRAQALAPHTGLAVRLARELIAAKLQGQLDVLGLLAGREGHSQALRQALVQVRKADALDQVRLLESKAAAVYWSAWSAVTLQFPLQRIRQVPAHWRTPVARRSPLTGSPRRAVNPCNALLNYLYGVAEAEATLALLAVGCDPSIGVLHADRAGRNSLALDLLETIRPEVDRYLLSLIHASTFSPKDFFETGEGQCRVLPPLSHRLSETAGLWAKLLGPTALRISRAFERSGATKRPEQQCSRISLPGSGGKVSMELPELLKGWRDELRQAGWGLGARSNKKPVPTKTCLRCGATFAHKRRSFCADCQSAIPGLASAAAHAARLLRQERGEDVRLPLTARQRLADARRRRSAEMRAWERAHSVTPNPHLFTETILPLLQGFTGRQLRDATGLNISYCRRVLRGNYVPHPMHWDNLRDLATRRLHGA